MRPAPYHRLSREGKRARAMALGTRTNAVCLACGTQTRPEDLLRHLEASCPGRRVVGGGR